MGGRLRYEFFSSYYDTKICCKRDEKSYSKSAEDVGYQPLETMSPSDIFEEAKAALSPGMKACLVIREGNTPLSEEVRSSYCTIHSFEELLPEAKSKRQKSEHETENEGKWLKNSS
ncbi:Enolase-phosphatase E1 [Holothuria leucospilota]|uniref:Enolase-phosphatase E1 n=1 Tax=Holothuria leucospilota TaxID=206669 RepID=A0A9Q1BRV2_HOLLE|nr:Enolase-phosphatase E1 [Holothuria leucospilota]